MNDDPNLKAALLKFATWMHNHPSGMCIAGPVPNWMLGDVQLSKMEDFDIETMVEDYWDNVLNEPALDDSVLNGLRKRFRGGG